MSKSEAYISVTARPKNGFRRIGRHFGETATIINVADLKKGELEALKDEPNLVVVESDGSAPTKSVDDTAVKAAEDAKAKAEAEAAELKEKLKAAETERDKAIKAAKAAEEKLAKANK